MEEMTWIWSIGWSPRGVSPCLWASTGVLRGIRAGISGTTRTSRPSRYSWAIRTSELEDHWSHHRQVWLLEEVSTLSCAGVEKRVRHWRIQRYIARGLNNTCVSILASKRALKLQRSERHVISQERLNQLHGQLGTLLAVKTHMTTRIWTENGVEQTTSLHPTWHRSRRRKIPARRRSRRLRPHRRPSCSVLPQGQVRHLLDDAEQVPREAVPPEIERRDRLTFTESWKVIKKSDMMINMDGSFCPHEGL